MKDKEEWRDRAKCKDQAPMWDCDQLPGRDASRRIMAKGLCSGCPVQIECGKDALRSRDVGVVRVGIPLDNIAGPTLFDQYDMIRDLIGVPRPLPGRIMTAGHIVWPRECTYCGNTMRPPRASGDLWPGTVSAASKTNCRACQRKINKRVDELGRRIVHGEWVSA